MARNHALVDGNKRLALGALVAFCGINGRRLTLTNDAAYDLVMRIATGHLDCERRQNRARAATPTDSAFPPAPQSRRLGVFQFAQAPRQIPAGSDAASARATKASLGAS